MASEHLTRLVAQGVATGESTAAIARRHGYSERGMRGLIQHSDTQAMIQEERELLDQAAERTRNELIGLAPAALGVLAEVLNDPHHSRRFQAATFVLDRLVPKRPESLTNVNVLNTRIDASLQADIIHGLELAKELQEMRANQPPIEDDPHLLAGEAALPKAESLGYPDRSVTVAR
jgi:hypothetical protein